MGLFSEKIAAIELGKESAKIGKADLRDLLSRQKAVEKKIRNSGRLSRFSTDIQLMFSLLRAYWRGEYRAVPWKTVTAMAGALIYVLNPLDLIPDLIFGLGFLDDAGVVALCLKLAESDLHRYAAWKELQRDHSGPGKN